MNWKQAQKLVFIIFLALIVSSLVLFAIYGEQFNLEQLREYVRAFGLWAPLIFILIYTFGTMFIPATPFMVVAALLFEFQYGFLYTVIGAFLSALLVFIISRKLGKEQIEQMLKKKHLNRLQKYNKQLETGGVRDVILLRILPIMPFNVLNLLLGVSKIKTRKFVLGSLIGFIPSHALTVFLTTFTVKIM